MGRPREAATCVVTPRLVPGLRIEREGPEPAFRTRAFADGGDHLGGQRASSERRCVAIYPKSRDSDTQLGAA